MTALELEAEIDCQVRTLQIQVEYLEKVVKRLEERIVELESQQITGRIKPAPGGPNA